jgi:hypothetical protein
VPRDAKVHLSICLHRYSSQPLTPDDGNDPVSRILGMKESRQYSYFSICPHLSDQFYTLILSSLTFYPFGSKLRRKTAHPSHFVKFNHFKIFQLMHHSSVISEPTHNLTCAHQETLCPPFDEFKSGTVRTLLATHTAMTLLTVCVEGPPHPFPQYY